MNGKQLKNSILQWAIQGKLVPQDPNDEPASVLLERIRAEKARLVNEGKIKKDKNESIIFRGDDNSHYEKFLATGEVKCIDDEIPFEIPQGWCWVRLRHILDIGSARRVHEKDWRSSGIPFYRAREIGKLAEYLKPSNNPITKNMIEALDTLVVALRDFFMGIGEGFKDFMDNGQFVGRYKIPQNR